MSLAARPLRSAPPSKPGTSRARRYFVTFITLLGLTILGTVIVLYNVRKSFGVPSSAFLTEEEVPWRPEDVIAQLIDPVELTENVYDRRGDAEWSEVAPALAEVTPDTQATPPPPAPAVDTTEESEWGIDGKGSGGYWMRKDWDGRVEQTTSWEHLYNVTIKEGESMPRIIHQTWIDDTLPPKWRKSWRECREGMPDYVTMLWTDDLSRKFIATHYPGHLDLFDGYRYPIQRADSIRYFILHHFGGIYMDLDIGCRRRIDPLLQGNWEVLLPVTKPVGVSNDMLVAKPRTRFFYKVISGLKSFNHQYVSNYPTVMFSTGPMMLSAQFGRYMSQHPVTPEDPHAHVRIVPTSLYGKNAPIETVPHSFFVHFYGSSWHSDDAGFITWLGRWGRNLLILGSVVLVIAVIRLMWAKVVQAGGVWAAITGRSAQYQMLPVSSPDSSWPAHLASGPPSPTFELPPEIGGALRWAGNMILAAPATLLPSGGRRQRGWLFFTPAAFQPTHGRRRTASEASQLPLRARGGREQSPPPYDSEASDSMDEVDAFIKNVDAESGAKRL